MKKNRKIYYSIVAAFAVIVAIAFVVVNRSDASALNVNDVGSDPAAFSGVITIIGIVAGVSQQDPTIIGMMDKKELQCTSPNCNKLYIPFKARDYSPLRGDEVRVTGSFVNMPGGYLFLADKIKVVKNHKIGG